MKFKVGDRIQIMHGLDSWEGDAEFLQKRDGYLTIKSIIKLGCNRNPGEHCVNFKNHGCCQKGYIFAGEENYFDGSCCREIDNTSRLYQITIKKPHRFKLKKYEISNRR